MALGRSIRNVLIIDSGNPCNKQTPHSHNFLTQDGETPSDIAAKAKMQVLSYPTVKFINDEVVSADKNPGGFETITKKGDKYSSRKLLFATGVKDILPEIEGFKECWGITVLHCPYCHGYEVRGEKLGILANGEAAFEYTKLISNWSKDITLFTNGKSSLSNEQTKLLTERYIKLVEKEILCAEHKNGTIKNLVFKDGAKEEMKALFYKTSFRQHSRIPEKLGCEITSDGYIKADDFQQTSVPGVYAAGDNCSMMRSVSAAIAAGTKAGAFINKEIIMENF